MKMNIKKLITKKSLNRDFFFALYFKTKNSVSFGYVVFLEFFCKTLKSQFTF